MGCLWVCIRLLTFLGEVGACFTRRLAPLVAFTSSETLLRRDPIWAVPWGKERKPPAPSRLPVPGLPGSAIMLLWERMEVVSGMWKSVAQEGTAGGKALNCTSAVLWY